MPAKKTTRSKAPAASKKSPSPATVNTKTTVSSSKRPFGAGAMLVVAICLTGAVIVIAAHEMKPSTRIPSTNAQTETEIAAVPSTTAAASAVASPVPVPTIMTEAADAKTSATNTAPVTIYGCLERSNDSYRLIDTDGADAPKARSWKTAFLKKGAASVELVDPGNRARLSSQVGHRLGVTGTMVEKQLHVRSIRRIASSCGN